MAVYSWFDEVPLCSISPEGWLRQYLVNQRHGLTGHLDECGFPFNTAGWAAPRVRYRGGDVWWPYEQVGYWVDGMVRCGHLLGDAMLLRKARRQIEYVLRHVDRDGYLGPPFLKRGLRWPHAVFFRALMAEHSATGDPRIPRALRRHYLSGTSRHAEGREVCNVEAMVWAWERTGDRRLLRAALRAYAEHCRRYPKADTSLATLLSPKRPTEHGVTYNEIGKLGAILYLATGRRRYLAAAVNAYRKLDRFCMLPDGVCSSSENLRGKDPLDTHETCDIADYTWSLGYLLMATGRAEYADKIERVCFNAAPGAVRSDFRALQYFSGCNQVLATASSNHNRYMCGTDWMSYAPNHEVQCCPGEVNRIMPNFAARMWMRERSGGLVAMLYGPSRITWRQGTVPVTIVEDTTYPVGEEVVFSVRCPRPVAFTLALRIPGWCRGATVTVNGKRFRGRCRPGTFVRIQRCFEPNDRVVLRLPMRLKLRSWPHGGVSVERGPLLFALGIAEQWRPRQVPGRTTVRFPAWDVYPASRWNYALVLHGRGNDGIQVVYGPTSEQWWDLQSAPIRLVVPARRVRGWGLQRRKRIVREAFFDGKKLEARSIRGDFVFTPPLPERKTLARRLGKLEKITLVPYGCTRLRIAVFPRA